MKKQIIYGYDTCVSCGAIIPEGQMVCADCKDKVGLGGKVNGCSECTPKPPKQKEPTKKQEDK